MNCPDVERVIDAYGDGELEAADAAEVRAHLAGCPACRQRVAARASLGRLIRRVPYYSAPDRLRVAVATTRRPARVSPRILAWAAMVTLAVSLGTGAGVRMVRSRQATVVRLVLRSRRRLVERRVRRTPRRHPPHARRPAQEPRDPPAGSDRRRRVVVGPSPAARRLVLATAERTGAARRRRGRAHQPDDR